MMRTRKVATNRLGAKCLGFYSRFERLTQLKAPGFAGGWLLEVDTEVATVRILDYVAVHDVGQVVNPMTMDGQIRGGIAQGIGTVLLEKYEFDENGQALTGSLADYLVPTSCEVPDIRVSHFTTPSPLTSLGIKGGGEGGRLAACPAITSAIDDALDEHGIFITELPVTPTRLFNLLREAGQPDSANPR